MCRKNGEPGSEARQTHARHATHALSRPQSVTPGSQFSGGTTMPSPQNGVALGVGVCVGVVVGVGVALPRRGHGSGHVRVLSALPGTKLRGAVPPGAAGGTGESDRDARVARERFEREARTAAPARVTIEIDTREVHGIGGPCEIVEGNADEHRRRATEERMDGRPEVGIGSVGGASRRPEPGRDEQVTECSDRTAPLAASGGELRGVPELAVGATESEVACGGPARERHHVVGVGPEQGLVRDTASRAGTRRADRVRRGGRGSRACPPRGAVPATRAAPSRGPRRSRPRRRECSRGARMPEQIVQRKADVGTLGTRPPGRNPELAEEAHHVVDAERAGMAKGRAQETDPVAIAVAAKRDADRRAGDPSSAPPARARRGSAEARPVPHEESGKRPRVAAAHRRAEGDVLVRRRSAARRRWRVRRRAAS